VAKAAFFPVELLEKRPDAWVCGLGSKTLRLTRFAADVEKGHDTVIMARPESLRLVEPGIGAVDGIVRMNVYLGHSVESFVETPNGEVLIQIDDPASKKIYPEGAKVSIEFNEERIRLLGNDIA
jgi:iron(III) transport system ATP-binding protein